MTKTKTTFEESLKKLEDVVSNLEGGQMPLEKSIANFEDGMKFVKECESKLKEAEGKVEKLIKDKSGSIETVNFES